jgi:hypothetical protein
MAADLGRWPIGQHVSPHFLSSVARVEGVEPLLFTDEFLPQGSAEVAFGLEKNLDIYPLQTARRVRIRVGARTEGAMACAHFMQFPVGNGPNPRVENGIAFTTIAANGNPSAQAPIVGIDGVTGLDCDRRMDVLLSCPSGLVTLSASSGRGPRTVLGFDAAGNIIAQATLPGATPQEVVELVGTNIVRVQIKAEENELVLHWLCHQCGPDQSLEVIATGFEHGAPVVESAGSAWPGGQFTIELSSPALERVTLRANGPAALIDFCVVPTSQNEAHSWEPVPDAPAPFCLPVDANGYPCRSRPGSFNEALDMAHARLRHSSPDDWPSSRFEELHDRLSALVIDGPQGGPMEERTVNVTADVQNGPAPLGIANLNLLQMLLLTSIDPSVAQMLGLYWIDQSADPEVLYDYAIIADIDGAFEEKGMEDLLEEIIQNGFTNLEAKIEFDVQLVASPPLPPPRGLAVHAISGATRRLNETEYDSRVLAGLTWELDTSRVPPPREASLLYHVWRGASQESIEPLKDIPPILPGASRGAVGAGAVGARPVGFPQPHAPSAWPQAAIWFVDQNLEGGSHIYQVSGVDEFGRHSPRSDGVSIDLVDLTTPPAPTGVQAFALDPLDPTLKRDAAYDTWFASLSALERQQLVGLRVQWIWTEDQARQTPNLAEFRIYLQPGRLNALLPKIVSKTSVDAQTTELETDLPNVVAADAFSDLWLRARTSTYKIVGSSTGGPLRIRIRNAGPNRDETPMIGDVATLVLPRDNALAHQLRRSDSVERALLRRERGRLLATCADRGRAGSTLPSSAARDR